METVLESLTKFALLVLQAVLLAALPFLAREAFKWLRAKALEAEKRLESAGHYEVVDLLRTFASLAVRAAEQIYGGKNGAEKRAYAIKIVSDFLEARGIYVDEKAIVAAIEAAVLDEFNQFREPKGSEEEEKSDPSSGTE